MLFRVFIILFLVISVSPTGRTQSVGLPSGSWDGYVGRPESDPFGTATGSPHTATSVTPKSPTVILLNNGMLIEGQIMPTPATAEREEGFAVKTDLGSMNIQKSNVERLGHDKLEIYRYKKSRVSGENCQELIALAEWALRYDMKEQGAENYRQALAVAPNNQIAHFIREWIAETEKKPENDADADQDTTKGLAAMQPPATSKAGNAEKAAQVDAASTVEKEILQEMEKELLEESLGVWAAKVPRNVIEAFSRKVQPVLLSRCAAADCHGSLSENDYQLYNPRQHGESATLKNMRATFRYIDPALPASSLLLAVPSRIHGGSRPIFTRSSRYQYETVSDWVHTVVAAPLVHRNRLLKAPENVDMLDDPPSHSAGPIVQVTRVVALPEEKTGEKVETSMKNMPVPQPSPLDDALDPAQFNKKYHAE